MRAVDIITKKRDGGVLTGDEIAFFVNEYVAGAIPDYQAAAWCMAVYFRGMTPRETADLTRAMAYSGSTLDLSDVSPMVLDKHSSGGVGDKTTLLVGPIVASLGVPVGKMSGRGLSFSGGTLDKLEAIPGLSVRLTTDQFKRQLRDVGLVVAGQTRELAPADGKLYTLRDVTGTVPSLPLIASSIMSKKIAAGANAIVLDVKMGHGAFMETFEDARELATLMVQIGQELGRRVSALIGDMSQPLGLAAGNALEVREVIAALQGEGPVDLREHCIVLAGEMLLLAGEATDDQAARAAAESALARGLAWEKFREFITAQGGSLAALDDPSLLPAAKHVSLLRASRDGFVASLNAREVGFVVAELGGGRARKEDAVDPSVGVVLAPSAKVGGWVRRGDALVWVHARSEADALAAEARLEQAYTFSDSPVTVPPLIHGIVRQSDLVS